MGVGAVEALVEEALAVVEGSGPDEGTECITSLHCWAITVEPRRTKHQDDRIQPVQVRLKGEMKESSQLE